MTITHTLENGTLTISPQGRLDTLTAPDFEAAAKELMKEADSAVIDLAGVDYISSAGLRALLALHKTGDIQVVHVAPAVMDVFSMTGFDKVLKIH